MCCCWKILIDCVGFCVDLQVVWMHGEKGEGLSQFYIPHSVAVDNFQRVCLQNIYNPHFSHHSYMFTSVHFCCTLWKSCIISIVCVLHVRCGLQTEEISGFRCLTLWQGTGWAHGEAASQTMHPTLWGKTQLLPETWRWGINTQYVVAF